MGVVQFATALSQFFNIAEGVPQLDGNGAVPLTLLADTGAGNDDIIQKKAGSFTTRTPAELWTDLYGTTDFYKNAGLWRTFARGRALTSSGASGVATIITGGDITVTGGIIGPNGCWRLRVHWDFTNTTGGNKFPSVRPTNAAGTPYFSNNFTNTRGLVTDTVVFNDNSESAQLGSGPTLMGPGFSTRAQVST